MVLVCLSLSVGSAGNCPARLHPGSATWLFMWAVQARAPLLPHFLFIETVLLSCPCVSSPIHLLNKRWESCVMRSFFSLCLFPGRQSIP